MVWVNNEEEKIIMKMIKLIIYMKNSEEHYSKVSKRWNITRQGLYKNLHDLQLLGYVEIKNGIIKITDKGKELLEKIKNHIDYIISD